MWNFVCLFFNKAFVFEGRACFYQNIDFKLIIFGLIWNFVNCSTQRAHQSDLPMNFMKPIQ